MTPRHPLPEPTLFQRTLAVLLIEAALISVALVAGCGKRPTAPETVRPICRQVTDTAWTTDHTRVLSTFSYLRCY